LSKAVDWWVSGDLRSGGLVVGRYRVSRDVGGSFEQFA